jgi:hypothetical protein
VGVFTVIDTQVEEVGPFAVATRWVPKRMGEKYPAVSTMWRWYKRGINGVRLETILVGTVRCTSRQALQRFFDAVTTASEGSSQPAGQRAEAKRLEASEAAERDFKAAAKRRGRKAVAVEGAGR